jgi:hypothetical protein
LSSDASRIRVAEISGSDFVTISGTAPAAWRTPPRSRAVLAYQTPDDPRRNRILLRTNARDLLTLIHKLREEGLFRIEHIYDY